MKQKIIISILLLVGLVALAAFINFNEKSVEAAYLGSGLPAASNNQTIRFDGTDWVASGVTIDASNAITAASFLYSSDARLKKDVKTLDNALAKVQALEGVSFNWKSNGEAEIGLIAQDVEKVLPELVVTGDNGYKAVKYGNLVSLLIEAVKEQQAEIDLLKTELETLR